MIQSGRGRQGHFHQSPTRKLKMKTEVEHADDGVTITMQMSKAEFDELMLTVADEADMKSFPDDIKLGRKEYCVTCALRDSDGGEIRTTEKAFNSAMASIQGAPKCFAETGNPSNSADRGHC